MKKHNQIFFYASKFLKTARNPSLLVSLRGILFR